LCPPLNSSVQVPMTVVYVTDHWPLLLSSVTVPPFSAHPKPSLFQTEKRRQSFSLCIFLGVPLLPRVPLLKPHWRSNSSGRIKRVRLEDEFTFSCEVFLIFPLNSSRIGPHAWLSSVQTPVSWRFSLLYPSLSPLPLFLLSIPPSTIRRHAYYGCSNF